MEARSILNFSDGLTEAVVLTILAVILDGVVAPLHGAVASVSLFEGLNCAKCSNSCSNSMHIRNPFSKVF